MGLVHILPFFATAITFVFAALVLNRYRQGRRKHTLMWGIGLLLYGTGTLAEAALAVTWSPDILRLWYLSGAMLTAAWLGQGTVYLLVRKPGIADRLAGLLIVATLAAAALVVTAPLDGAAYQAGVPISSQYKQLLTRAAPMVVLTVSLNIYGSIMLIGGALWSAYLFARKRVLRHRVIGNVLIAAGAMFPASAGAFVRLGLADWLYASELAGAILMFAGFWLATQPQPADRPVRSAARA